MDEINIGSIVLLMMLPQLLQALGGAFGGQGQTTAPGGTTPGYNPNPSGLIPATSPYHRGPGFYVPAPGQTVAVAPYPTGPILPAPVIRR